MNNDEIVVKKSINDIVPNKYQPRKYFDEMNLAELSNSIKQYGILNPILVRQVGDKYEIIAGERRYRAAKLCGMTEVPVIVKNVTDSQSAELALIENLHRQDLTAVEAAKSYEEILKLGNYTQSELASKIGKSQANIANKIRLLSLPEEIQQAVIEKKISERHARSLLEVEDREKQFEIFNRIINEKLTVKETEELIEIANTSDEDIEQAIKDIMKSLNIKEERESDNMNNGNFFPTYDNNMTPNNNMNNQTPNQPIMTQENVMPTFMTSPSPETEPTPPVINPTLDTPATPEPVTEMAMPQSIPEQPQPMMDTPLFNPNTQIPNFNVGTPDMPLNNEPTPMNEPIQEMVMPQSIPEQPQPMMDTPLFTPQTNETPVMPTEQPAFTPEPVQDNINESFYEVPVNVSPIIETPATNDRFTEIENLLSNNGISYKAYSNDTGHCIIIEI